MAPKKKEQQKMSLGDFLGDQSLGSWADEMEDAPMPGGNAGARAGYGGDRPSYGSGGGGFGGDRAGSYADRGFAVREQLPLPSKPPYTAHLGNLSFDATEGDVQDFFADCEVTNVRIVEDKLDRKPKGFGYVEFGSVEGLKKALDLSGTPFQGRNVRVSVAEPPKDRPEARDISDWTRKGPLPDIGGQRRTSDRGFGGPRRDFDAGSDAGSERGSGMRRAPPSFSDGKERDFGNWERKGPLSPAAAPPSGPPREGGRLRSFDGAPPAGRRQSPAWGEGQGRREFQPATERPERPERPQREPTASELDNQWRTKMRPDAPAATSPSGTPDASVPSSPAPAAAAPATRPKLNLAKRTVSEAQPAADATPSDKPNPFGAARPIDTATREKEIEEKRQLAIRQKKEADDKAREEKKAKDAAEKANKSSAPATPVEKGEGGEDKARSNFEILQRVGEEGETVESENANGEIVDDKAVKPQEVVRKPSETEGSWRRKSSTPAAAAGSTTEALDDDGWSTVTKPTKNTKNNRRGGPPARAIAS